MPRCGSKMRLCAPAESMTRDKATGRRQWQRFPFLPIDETQRSDFVAVCSESSSQQRGLESDHGIIGEVAVWIFDKKLGAAKYAYKSFRPNQKPGFLEALANGRVGGKLIG